MYESYYGFTEKPFSLFPDHRFLFLNRRYKLALSLLEFGVLNKNGMILLTGDPGMGKTTLLQRILAEVDDSVIVGYVTFTHDTDSSVLPWVLKAFGLQAPRDTLTDMFQTVEDFFSQVYRQGRGVLLVVDEAQNFKGEQLEELRLLYNFNEREGPVFQILLAGHTQLRECLNDPRLSAFVQRIGTDFSLEPLSEEDTVAYIRHRTLVAGGSASIFSDKACNIVHQCSRGIPRLINQLCETSLIYGFSEQAGRITDTLVADAARDRQSSGIFAPIQDDGIERLGEDRAIRAEVVSAHAHLDQGNVLAKQEAASSPVHQQGDRETGLSEDSGPKPQDFPQHSSKLKPTQCPTSEPGQLVSNPEKYWKDGLKLRDDGWCLEAIQSFKRAATHSQYRTSGWFQVGQCYLVLGRKEEALKAFQTSLADSNSSPLELASIQYAMGQVLEDLGESEKSKQYYQLAHSSDPTFDSGRNSIHSSRDEGGRSKVVMQQDVQTPWIARLFRVFWD